MMLWRVTLKVNTVIGIALKMPPLETRWLYKRRWAARLRAWYEMATLSHSIIPLAADVNVEAYFPGDNVIQFKRVA